MLPGGRLKGPPALELDGGPLATLALDPDALESDEAFAARLGGLEVAPDAAEGDLPSLLRGAVEGGVWRASEMAAVVLYVRAR